MGSLTEPARDTTPTPAARGRGVTSYDVARAAGVSQSAVSRCFKPGASIAPATRARVEAAARALGYAPNAIARSLITRRSGMVGVLVTELTTRFHPEFLHHLGQELRARGQHMLLLALEHEREVETVLPRLLEYQVDGVVSAAGMTAAQLEICAARGVPVVLYNRHLPGDPAAAVCTDQADGMRRLAGALHGAGLRRMALVTGPPDSPVSGERARGFLGRLGELGLEPAGVVAADFSYEGGRAAATSLLSGAGPRPDAVVCANDHLALGAMDACRFDHGLRVPEDVSVTGFDDVAEAAWPTYALTTVRQRVRLMTRAAAAMLGERIASPDLSPERRLFPGLLVARGSARLAPTP